MTGESVTFGKKCIPFDVGYSSRKTLQIAVYPDQTVVVTSPHDATRDDIRRRVRRRGSWILRQQDYFSQFEPRHELCHLSLRNHGPRFWHLLREVMPDWQHRKSKLEASSA